MLIAGRPAQSSTGLMSTALDASATRLAKPVGIALLTLLGLAGNAFHATLFFGVDFLFGSIATLIAAFCYGPLWGAVSAAVSGSYTILLWHHPYAALILLGEALFVGLLLRRKERELVLTDVLYWLTVGIPLIAFFYVIVLDFEPLGTAVVMLKQSVNGMFNALVAGLLVTFLPITRWLGKPDLGADGPMRTLFLRIFVSVMVLPALLLIMITGRQEFYWVTDHLGQRLESTVSRIRSDIDHWHHERIAAVTSLAAVVHESRDPDSFAVRQVAQSIARTFPDALGMYVTTSSGTFTAFPAANARAPTGPAMTLEGCSKTESAGSRDTPSGDPAVGDLQMGCAAGEPTDFSRTLLTFPARPQDSPGPVVNVAVPIVDQGALLGYAAAEFSVAEISSRLFDSHIQKELDASIVDPSRRVIATTHGGLEQAAEFARFDGGTVSAFADGMHHWLPRISGMAAMERWRRSIFYRELTLEGTGLPWTLVVEASVEPFQLRLYRLYATNLALVLGWTVLASLLALFISARLTRPIHALIDMTSGLPHHIEDLDARAKFARWPKAYASEIRLLVDNFQHMAKRLNAAFQQLEHAAYHDTLTGLPNRARFHDRLVKALAKAKRERRSLAVLFCDVDELKGVNDSYGHDIGDAFIEAVAHRLRSELRSTDTIARQGGDEFLVLLDPIGSSSDAEATALRILESLDKPLRVGELEFRASISIGIGVFPDHAADPALLVKCADIAVYHAKQAGGGGYRMYQGEGEGGSPA